MERITMETISERLHNVNRRFVLRGVDVCWFVQRRNGYVGLDRMRPSDGAMLANITCGTKREIADFLHAAMVGMDDSTPTS